MLQAKEETELQGMTDRSTEIGRCCGIEMNVEKNEGNENLKETIASTYHDKLETTGKCELLQRFG